MTKDETKQLAWLRQVIVDSVGGIHLAKSFDLFVERLEAAEKVLAEIPHERSKYSPFSRIPDLYEEWRRLAGEGK